jgi:hypothetical protein
MKTATFNPFEDRLSRDIRNDLSESILEVLSSGSIAPAQAVAEAYKARGIDQVYQNYIEDRIARYASSLTRVSPQSSILRTGAVLWDNGLYFEVHEVLEPPWMSATGDDKLLLQAMIRAAGVYINLELGYHDRAAKISTKALPVLRRFRDILQRDLNADALVEALEKLSAEPPLLARRD